MTTTAEKVEPQTQEMPTFEIPRLEDSRETYDLLTEELQFSRHKAPEALEKQCVLIDLAGEALNKASRQLNAIKLMLEVREAEIDTMIRRKYDQAGTKYTEKSISAELATHPEIVSLKQCRNDAEDIRNMWMNRKSSYESRGRDLHDEVSLIVCGYSNSR